MAAKRKTPKTRSSGKKIGAQQASAPIPPTSKNKPGSAPADTLDDRIARAKKSGKYLILTFYVKNGRVYGDWNTQNFPTGDLSFVRQYVTNTAVSEIRKSVQ